MADGRNYTAFSRYWECCEKPWGDLGSGSHHKADGRYPTQKKRVSGSEVNRGGLSKTSSVEPDERRSIDPFAAIQLIDRQCRTSYFFYFK